MAYQSAINPNSKFYNTLSPTVQSDAISVAATNTTTKAVDVPIGAYVTKVMMLSTIALANCDVDVGDGDSADRFIDGVTTMTQYDIVGAPNIASGAACDEVNGRYYVASDTIDVVENTTGSADTAAGSVKVLVWYHF